MREHKSNKNEQGTDDDDSIKRRLLLIGTGPGCWDSLRPKIYCNYVWLLKYKRFLMKIRSNCCRYAWPMTPRKSEVGRQIMDGRRPKLKIFLKISTFFVGQRSCLFLSRFNTIFVMCFCRRQHHHQHHQLRRQRNRRRNAKRKHIKLQFVVYFYLNVFGFNPKLYNTLGKWLRNDFKINIYDGIRVRFSSPSITEPVEWSMGSCQWERVSKKLM